MLQKNVWELSLLLHWKAFKIILYYYFGIFVIYYVLTDSMIFTKGKSFEDFKEKIHSTVLKVR
jgi:hypothetical protein